MPRGFDTTQDPSSDVTEIRGSGCDFLARCLSQSHWEVVGPKETAALSAAGVGRSKEFDHNRSGPRGPRQIA